MNIFSPLFDPQPYAPQPKPPASNVPWPDGSINLNKNPAQLPQGDPFLNGAGEGWWGDGSITPIGPSTTIRPLAQGGGIGHGRGASPPPPKKQPISLTVTGGQHAYNKPQWGGLSFAQMIRQSQLDAQRAALAAQGATLMLTPYANKGWGAGVLSDMARQGADPGIGNGRPGAGHGQGASPGDRGSSTPMLPNFGAKGTQHNGASKTGVAAYTSGGYTFDKSGAQIGRDPGGVLQKNGAYRPSSSPNPSTSGSGGSSARTPSPVSNGAFKGSSTGTSYTVGKTYTNGGGSFVAQKDGTFKKI